MDKVIVQCKRTGSNLTLKIGSKVTRLANLEEKKIEKLLQLVKRYDKHGRGKDLEDIKELVAKATEKPKDATVVKSRQERKVVEKEIKQELIHGPFEKYRHVPGLVVKADGVRLEGLSFDLPTDFIDQALEWHNSDRDVRPLINFMYKLADNPHKTVRNGIFKYLSRQKFMLTPNGFVVTYRRAHLKEQGQAAALTEYIKEAYASVRKRKKATEGFTVFQHADKSYGHDYTAKVPDGVIRIGIVKELYTQLAEAKETVYTDNHTHTFSIVPGIPVEVDYKQVNTDGQNCNSYGLHLGNANYVRTNSSLGSHLLICLVDPSRICAIPNTESDKLRTMSYYPVRAISTKELETIEASDLHVYELDYEKFNLSETLERLKLIGRTVTFENLPESKLKDLKARRDKLKSVTLPPVQLPEDDMTTIVQRRIATINSVSVSSQQAA